MPSLKNPLWFSSTPNVEKLYQLKNFQQWEAKAEGSTLVGDKPRKNHDFFLMQTAFFEKNKKSDKKNN